MNVDDVAVAKVWVILLTEVEAYLAFVVEVLDWLPDARVIVYTHSRRFSSVTVESLIRFDQLALQSFDVVARPLGELVDALLLHFFCCGHDWSVGLSSLRV